MRSLAILPFSDSDKSSNQNLIRPDGQQIPLYVYPVTADGEYISKQVEEELVRTSPRLKIIHGMWSRQQGLHAARMIGHQLGAQAVMVGTVMQYRTITKLSTDGPAWIQASLGEVGFTVDIVDTQDGTVLLRCQKAATSLNFLEKPYSVNTDQGTSNITQTLNTALHGATAAEITSYVTANLMKELAQTFSSIRWEEYPLKAHTERTRPSNDIPSPHDSNVAQSSEESKKEVRKTLETIGLQDIEQLQAGVVKITARSPGGASKVGTGFVVRLDRDVAYIVTAAHVVAGDPQPQVEFFTKRNAPVPAEVLPGAEGGDEIRGLALLMVKGKDNIPSGLSALLLTSNIRLSGGEDIILIGFPRGVGPWAVIKGNISSRQGRDIYFSPTVGEGNSGGPIIQNGKVVGLVGAGGQLIGQGVTARSIEAYIDGFGITLQETAPANVTEAPSTIGKSWDNVLVSLKVQELNSALRREFNIPINVSGLMVNHVDPGGAAEKSGVQRGDIITEVNHTRISDLSQYHAIAGAAKKNETVVLLLNRRGNDLAIAIQP